MTSDPTVANLLQSISEELQALRFDTAMQQLEDALTAHPDDPRLQIKKGVVLRQLHRNGDSIAHLSAVLEQHPRNLQALHELANSFRVAGNFEATQKLLDRMLLQQPRHRGALVARVDVANQVQDFDAAMGHVRDALAIYPNDVRVQIKMGAVLRHLHRNDESIAHLASLLEQHPNSIPIMHDLAASHRAAGSFDAALKLLDEILALQPRHRGALVARVDAANQLQDFGALSQFIKDELSLLRSSGDLAENGLGALLIAKVLVALPAMASHDFFDEAAEWHIANRSTLPSILLWTIYERADLIGKGTQYDELLGELLSRKTLGLAECRQILAKAFQLQLTNWKEIGLVLQVKLPAHSRPMFELEYRALTVGADIALRDRQRWHPQKRPVLECLLISRLLKQAGKQRAAVRYLGIVFVHHPYNTRVFHEYSMTSISTGAPHRFVKAKEEILFGKEILPHVQVAIAQCHIELNQLEEACGILEKITHPQLKLTTRATYVDVLIALEKAETAEKIVDEMRSTQSQKSYIHFITCHIPDGSMAVS